jgi:hypothetical protein
MVATGHCFAMGFKSPLATNPVNANPVFWPSNGFAADPVGANAI